MSKTKISALTALIMTAFLVVSVTQAWAATMKFRMVIFHTRVETSEVGDVEGHNLYLGESTGLASLETGEVAVVTIRWSADYTKGAGIVQAYIHLTFEDRSIIGIKGQTTARPYPKGEGTLFEARQWELYQGSGRYAGIKGTGTLTGRRVVALGAPAQAYFDAILTYTLP
jgi:hypothetical protein